MAKWCPLLKRECLGRECAWYVLSRAPFKDIEGCALAVLANEIRKGIYVSIVE